MKKKFIAMLLVLSLVMTGMVVSPTKEVRAAVKWKTAYKKKLENISAGIYSKYAYVKMDNSKTPVMVVIMNGGDLWTDTYEVSFYQYKKGTVKRIGKFETTGSSEDTKFRRNSKKFVLSYPSGFGTDYYVFKKINSKVKVSTYSSMAVEGQLMYAKTDKTFKYISKKAFKKATKTKKKVKMKEHFAGHMD